jgi:hypothetical protein
MSFYSEIADTANELITEFGQTVIVTNYEVGTEDPSTGVVPKLPSQYSTIGVLLDYDYRNFGDTTAFESAVSSGDKRLLLKAASVVNAGDNLLVNGVSYRAHVIKSVNPAGTNVVYDIWVKR